MQACPDLFWVQIAALAPFVSVIVYRSIVHVSACLSVRLSHVLIALPGWPRADDGQDRGQPARGAAHGGGGASDHVAPGAQPGAGRMGHRPLLPRALRLHGAVERGCRPVRLRRVHPPSRDAVAGPDRLLRLPAALRRLWVVAACGRLWAVCLSSGVVAACAAEAGNALAFWVGHCPMRGTLHRPHLVPIR
jgi:hypothetical protein